MDLTGYENMIGFWPGLDTISGTTLIICFIYNLDHVSCRQPLVTQAFCISATLHLFIKFDMRLYSNFNSPLGEAARDNTMCKLLMSGV